MTKKEIRLIKGIKSGNEKYLEKCIRQYTPYVAYIVGNIIGLALPQEDKEEVISDVFVTLWKKRELLDESRSEKLQGYIGTIARNLSKNRLRDQYKRNFGQELDEAIESPVNIEEIMLEAEMKEELQKCISLMSKIDQRVFLKYYYYYKPVKVISEEENLSESAVKSKLMRGRQKMRKMIEEEYDE